MCSMDEQDLKEDVLRILRVLTSEDDFSQRDLSGRLGMSLGKTNYLLKSLAQKGLIKVKRFTTRPWKTKKLKYILTKKGLDEKLRLTYYFLKKKEKEYLELKRESKKGLR